MNDRYRIDMVFDGVDALVRAEQFRFLDWLLRHLDERTLGFDEEISLLHATMPVKSKLPIGRPRMLQKLRAADPSPALTEGLD